MLVGRLQRGVGRWMQTRGMRRSGSRNTSWGEMWEGGLSAYSGKGSRVTSASEHCCCGNSFCLCCIEEAESGRKIALRGSREGDELCLIPAQPGSDPWHRGCCRKLPFPPLPLHSSLSCPGDTGGVEIPGCHLHSSWLAADVTPSCHRACRAAGCLSPNAWGCLVSGCLGATSGVLISVPILSQPASPEQILEMLVKGNKNQHSITPRPVPPPPTPMPSSR